MKDEHACGRRRSQKHHSGRKDGAQPEITQDGCEHLVAGKQLSQRDRGIDGKQGKDRADDHHGNCQEEYGWNSENRVVRLEHCPKLQQIFRRKICHCGQGNQGDQGNCTNQQQIDQIKPDGSDGQLGDNQHPGLDRERVHQIALVGIEIFIKTDSKIDCQDHGKTAENQDVCDVKYKVSHIEIYVGGSLVSNGEVYEAGGGKQHRDSEQKDRNFKRIFPFMGNQFCEHENTSRK